MESVASSGSRLPMHSTTPPQKTPAFEPSENADSVDKQKSSGPKKSKTAYNFFQLKERENACNEVWERLGLNCSKVLHNEEVARMIGKRWRELPSDRKQEFQRLALEDKKRYLRETEEQRIKASTLQQAQTQHSASHAFPADAHSPALHPVVPTFVPNTPPVLLDLASAPSGGLPMGLSPPRPVFAMVPIDGESSSTSNSSSSLSLPFLSAMNFENIGAGLFKPPLQQALSPSLFAGSPDSISVPSVASSLDSTPAPLRNVERSLNMKGNKSSASHKKSSDESSNWNIHVVGAHPGMHHTDEAAPGRARAQASQGAAAASVIASKEEKQNMHTHTHTHRKRERERERDKTRASSLAELPMDAFWP
mmetsp:Transcript_23910/g.42365  ORF Transcript_23910/g.42365 Transcript_23910/m.42365 type:complete len:365 (-) Transcript_23910:276-1370(-)